MTTGSVYVFAAAAAEAGVDAVLFEVLHELLDGVFFGFGEEGLVDRIIFNNVDEIGGDLAEDLHQFVGVLFAIVEVLEEDVFEGDLVAGLLIEMIQGFDEGFEIVGFVDGHDLVALFVIGRVQRDGELEFNLVVAELADHLSDSGCGDGDASGAHGQAVGGGDALDGFEDVLIIEQGFAHAHEDDVGEFFCVDAFRLLVDEDDFVIDLVVVEVAFAFHIAGGAELTAQRAADLGGDAGGLAFVGRDQDAFYEVVVGGAETAFDGAIRAILGGVDGEGGESEIPGELLAQLFAEVGHVFEAMRLFCP